MKITPDPTSKRMFIASLSVSELRDLYNALALSKDIQPRFRLLKNVIYQALLDNLPEDVKVKSESDQQEFVDSFLDGSSGF